MQFLLLYGGYLIAYFDCAVLGCPVQEGTGRIVMWNLGILNSFTMEVILRVVFLIFCMLVQAVMRRFYSE